MLKKNALNTFLIFAFTLVAFKSQQVSQKKFPIKSDFIAVDNIGNLYAVKDNELIKYSSTGKMFARYSDIKLGNISHVDVTNPLKILLYYRDYQQIVFLDNQLSLNSQNVSLEKLGFEQSELVCSGANNSFWIYDKQNNELLRFNENSKKIAATGNLKQVLKIEISPNYMLEHNGLLFLNCPDSGIYVFDMFGAYVKVISLKNLSNFQSTENILYFNRDSSLCSYHYKQFEESCQKIHQPKGYKQVLYMNKHMYLTYKDSVVVLPIN